MDNSKYINDIFNNTINDFLGGVEDYHNSAMKDLYLSYLIKEYSNKTINDYLVKYYSKLEVLKWKNFDFNGKLSYVIDDDYLERLKVLSLEAFESSRKYLEAGVKLDRKKANEMINQMNALLSKVKPFNKSIAIYYHSEGVKDLSLSSEISDTMSLRIGSWT
ncbi:MAG: hypothetical protein U0M66_01765 [Bacilli bacterium]|nr:hypothetical protein [Bacilli bacterium]